MNLLWGRERGASGRDAKALRSVPLCQGRPMKMENEPAAIQPLEQSPTPAPSDNTPTLTPRIAATMVFQGAPMHHLWSRIHAAAFRSTAVLIRGEVGTGKELAARQVHTAGPRA